ncbi:hypothetical protein ccbrp13_60710 [Ktedonobacteria bacterium brp13]|nr:hypothetical protein ccbrp13_60710 [Ktedonobacteria bacterium brp13]
MVGFVGLVSFCGPTGSFERLLSAYRVSKQGGPTRSWQACRCAHYREYKLHLGITPHLTISHLEQAAATLQSRVAHVMRNEMTADKQ